MAESIERQRARFAAEHLMKRLIADSMASYGEANWRQDLAPTVVARLRVYFDYQGRRRRVVMVGLWEEDPHADSPPLNLPPAGQEP